MWRAGTDRAYGTPRSAMTDFGGAPDFLRPGRLRSSPAGSGGAVAPTTGGGGGVPLSV